MFALSCSYYDIILEVIILIYKYKEGCCKMSVLVAQEVHKLQKMEIRVLISNYSSIEKILESTMVYFDDFVFFSSNLEDKNSTNNVFFHLDFEEYDYMIESKNPEKDEAVLYVRLKSLGENWDELNAEYGLTPEDITTDLVLNSYLDNYVIFVPGENDKAHCNFKVISAVIRCGDDRVTL